jgi:carbamoyltransferase
MSNIVLSIHYGHNSTVGLSIDGEIKCLISEERLNRIKNSYGYPKKALEYVINKYLDGDTSKITKVVLNDYDMVFVNDLEFWGYEAKTIEEVFPIHYKNRTFFIRKYLKYKNKCSNTILKLKFSFKKFIRTLFLQGRFIKRINKKLTFPFIVTKAKLIKIIASKIDVPPTKIELFDHHSAHMLASMYFIDENKKYLCFTLDGAGDWASAKVGIWDKGKLEILYLANQVISLGHLYYCVTGFLGMKGLEHEFKVMGMAPYAKDEHMEKVKKIFEQIIQIDHKGRFVSHINSTDYFNYLVDNLSFERFDNLCGGIQKFTEDIMTKWIKTWINITGISDITVGGGVMMNVKAVKKVYEMKEVNSIFVCPSAGDESLPIGGLFYGNKILNQPIKKMTNLYLGSENNDDEIENYLKTVSDRYSYQKLSDDEIAQKTAQLLSQDEVIARCVGREEWGARALGNRSILCNANHFKNIDILNQYIKDRDFWMPFTPSILKEDIDKYIVNPRQLNAPYMCITFESTPLARQHLPAALHPYDKTIRPQSVDKDWNPKYHHLISEFKKLTGISGLLNTSFNLHGEPNVSNYKDVIHTMDNSKLKYAIINSFLVVKL